MIHQEQFSIETKGHRHMVAISDQVAAIVGQSKIKTGIAHVFCVGSTAAVGTIEFEPGLERDLPEMLDRLIRPAASTATNWPGMTATAIRICRPRCWARRFRCLWPTANPCWARGSRSSTWNATFARVGGPSW